MKQHMEPVDAEENFNGKYMFRFSDKANAGSSARKPADALSLDLDLSGSEC